jgi:hypothetical protein
VTDEEIDYVIERVYRVAYEAGFEDCRRIFGYELGYREGRRIERLKSLPLKNGGGREKTRQKN